MVIMLTGWKVGTILLEKPHYTTPIFTSAELVQLLSKQIKYQSKLLFLFNRPIRVLPSISGYQYHHLYCLSTFIESMKIKNQNLKSLHKDSRHSNVNRYELAPKRHVDIKASGRLDFNFFFSL